jgi:hypothetical protein
MRITIRLGGHTAPWRFRDGDRLGDWIASRPWHTRSEVRVVRLARSSGVGAVFDAIQQAVVGADQGTTEVQCMRLSPQQVNDTGFETSLARRLGVSIEADRYAMIQAVARRLADRPRLCLVPPLNEEQPKIAQDAEACVDLMAKVVAGARACVLIADTRDRPLAGVAFDLTVGAPPAEVGLSADPPEILWFRYVHIRLAWEAGGDTGRAEEMVDAIGRLTPEDDTALERGLNRYAAAEYDKLCGETRRKVGNYISAVIGGRARHFQDGEPAFRELKAIGLYWEPGGLNAPMPAPWLARALLLQRPQGVGAECLRGCLVCMPLAQDLLTVCLQLEARERGSLVAHEDGAADLEAKQLWDRFQHGISLTYRLYPAGCPAAPGGPWSFASFGQVLRHFGDDRRRDALYRLLELRNHLAHGHYTGWEAVGELIEIRRLLWLNASYNGSW